MSHLPTAEELSEPGALAAYLVHELRHTPDHTCRLPPGVIRVTGERPRLNMIEGGQVFGSGMPRYPSDSPKAGRRHPKVGPVDLSTRIVAGQEYRELLLLEDVYGLAIDGVGFENRSGVGVRFSSEPGKGAAFNRFERVAFHNCLEGVRAGDPHTPQSGQFNAADVVFSGVSFSACGVGLRVLHAQGVNYVFDGLCSWGDCRTAIDLVRGGGVTVTGGSTYGGQTFLRVRRGGPNVGALVVTGLRMDRSKRRGDPIPIVLDARGAESQVRAALVGVSICGGLREAEGFQVVRIGSRHHRVEVIAPGGATGVDWTPRMGEPDDATKEQDR